MELPSVSLPPQGGQGFRRLGRKDDIAKRALTEASAPSVSTIRRLIYCGFAEHLLVAASHTPPAFWQSASVFAAVTSPAKAALANASDKARAIEETSAFMTFTPLPVGRGRLKNAVSKASFRTRLQKQKAPLGTGLSLFANRDMNGACPGAAAP
jgi:hypothetical protein